MPRSRISLDGKWKITGCDFCEGGEQGLPLTGNDTWLDAEVPGDVHNDLFRAGETKDPYYSDNSRKLKWITEKDWIYRKTFRVPDGFLKDITSLVFEGIDTYADVWLNGSKLGSTENMFQEYSFDITGILRAKEDNELLVRVKSIRRRMEQHPYEGYFGCFNTARIFVRKAQCHFGWDWAPDLPATGIWGSVALVAESEGNITDVAVRTRLDGQVSFFIDLDRKTKIDELNQSKEEIKQVKIEDDLVVEADDGQSVVTKQTAVRGGKNFITLQVADPKLWWPNGYGEPFLYSYRVRLLRKGIEIDRREGRFGIREVELLQEPAKDGGFGFRFEINKTPVYCKGANWVPLDCFTGAVQDAKYRSMIALAREANFNMLRVWGGGIYEKDLFYDLCDENGILVWQDFMFACADIPDDHPWFVDLVIPEAEYQVRRLRNHPCLVYWCGGNEKTGSHGLKVAYGRKMAHYILRGVCGDLDPTRPYNASSPSSFSDLGNDQDSGDTHCNCLENSFKKGMTSFRDEINRITAAFNSECAIQGPARYQSMARFMPSEKMWPLNELWRFRYKDNPYNTLVEEYLDIQKRAAEILFGECSGVRDFLKKAMAAHAEILRAEIEHQRCRKWGNSGFMFWMYSDCWPTGTWAAVDYYGLPKPAYYTAKRAYEPFAVLIQQAGEGDCRVYIANDLPTQERGRLVYGQATVDGDVLWEQSIDDLSVGANVSFEAAGYGNELRDAPDSYLFARFTGEKHQGSATFFHKLWRDIQWPEPGLTVTVLEKTAHAGKSCVTVEVKAAKYARMVNLNIPDQINASFSDNFFDLEAGEVKTVTIVSQRDFDADVIRADHWLTEWN